MKTRGHIERGFTLVEVIIVMVITGIIGAIIAVFIRVPVQNYVDTAGRAELTDIADTAVRRISREMRLAVPNSIRDISSQEIEFVPSKAGGRYLASEDAAPAANPPLSFTDTANRAFTVVGIMPAGRQAIVPGDHIVVFNEGIAPASVWAANGNRAVVESVAGNVVTLVSNPFAARTPPLPHPHNRFLVTNGPVRYVCVGTNLLRYERYPFSDAMAATPSTVPAILAGNVKRCEFEYKATTNTRSGVVTLTLELERTGATGPESVKLVQQIHVDNTP